MNCPKCGNPEVNPATGLLFIRAFKVFDERGAWSQCLVCSGFYEKSYFIGDPHDRFEYVETPERENTAKGWFVS